MLFGIRAHCYLKSDGLFCQRGLGSWFFAEIMYSVRVPWAWSIGSRRVTAGFRESDLSRFYHSRDSFCNRERNHTRFVCKYLFASLMENISVFSICRSCSETLFFPLIKSGFRDLKTSVFHSILLCPSTLLSITVLREG